MGGGVKGQTSGGHPAAINSCGGVNPIGEVPSAQRILERPPWWGVRLWRGVRRRWVGEEAAS